MHRFFSVILKNIDPKLKKLFLTCIQEAIKSNNKELVEYLFKENAVFDDALIQAVETKDCELVDIVLKYVKKPYLINLIRQNGTALCCAVQNDDLAMVKKLLSIPGIDPSLGYYTNGMIEFPLKIAIERNKNLDIINAILDFYGDDIQNQKQQLDGAAESAFHLYCETYINSANAPIIERILDIKGIDLNQFYPTHVNLSYNNHGGWHNENQGNLNSDSDDYSDENLSNDECNFSDDDYDDFDSCEQNYKDIYIRRNAYYLNIEEDNDRSDYMNFLSVACAQNDAKMVEKLLKIDSININKYSQISGYMPLMFAVKSNLLNIVKMLIENPKININQRNFNSETALTIAVKKNLNRIVDLLVKSDKFDPDESLFELSCCIANRKTLKQLISCKYFEINKISISLLHMAVSNNDIETVDKIINNPSFEKYKSENSIVPEIVLSISKNNFDIFKKLLGQVNNDVNICDSENVSLLVHAARNLNEQVLDFILNDEKFDSKKSDILTAFVESYSYGKVFEYNETNSINEYNYQHLDKLSLKRQRLVNLYEKKVKKYQRIDEKTHELREKLDILENKIETERNELQRHKLKREYQQKSNQEVTESQKSDMELVLTQKIDNDVNVAQIIAKKIEEHDNYIERASNDLKQKFRIALERLENEQHEEDINDVTKFKSQKVFILTILNKLYDYDKSHENLIDFNKLLPNGESFFTEFNKDFVDIEKVSNFLLEHGVDPNIPSARNVYPLEKAIFIGSYQLALSLVNSNKIDYSVKLKSKCVINDHSNDCDCSNTYLHFAACSINPSIIDLFLFNHLIDINATNDMGNTPLMEACASKMKNNIGLFFNYNNLDYSHRNKEGKDAIDLFKDNYKIENDDKQGENDGIIDDKKKYFNKLRSLFYLSNTWRAEMPRFNNH